MVYVTRCEQEALIFSGWTVLVLAYPMECREWGVVVRDQVLMVHKKKRNFCNQYGGKDDCPV